jgi:hypothetical protein
MSLGRRWESGPLAFFEDTGEEAEDFAEFADSLRTLPCFEAESLDE